MRKRFFLCFLFYHIYEPPNTSIIFHVCIIILSCSTEPNHDKIILCFLQRTVYTNNPWTRKPWEGKKEAFTLFAHCTVCIFVGLIPKGCGQFFIKSIVQPTKKIPSLLALVINTLEKDPAPSSGLDFLQGIAWAAVRDRQTARCDSTFPENHLDKTLKQGHNELCQLRFSAVYKATCWRQ